MRRLAALTALASLALTAPALADDRSALTPLQDFIGDWKGVGKPKRNARPKDFWQERASWSWAFEEGRARLALTSSKARYLCSGALSAVAEDRGLYRLDAVLGNGKTKLRYEGRLNERGSLVLEAKQETTFKQAARVTMRTVANGDRLLMLYERKVGATTWMRMGEVGFTRVGSAFGKAAKGIECIVTGGKGTIPVSYKGKTYYVCCGGCKDLFNEDPESCLADAAERAEEEKKKKKAKSDQG